jgi:hypothetical protein
MNRAAGNAAAARFLIFLEEFKRSGTTTATITVPMLPLRCSQKRSFRSEFPRAAAC